jgi:hypothetical protein
VGALDADLVSEASGLEVPGEDADRLYLINDSGDGGRFYVTRGDGSGTRVVTIAGFDPVDTEDMTFGDCGDGDSCLFIADIGDNDERRAEVEIVVVRLAEPLPDTVTPERRIRMRYPDGPHDAESMALAPNGDLIILTKAPEYATLSARPSVFYRLPYRTWSRSGSDAVIAAPMGELAMAEISSDPFSGSLPTAMDISPDGALLVLTYVGAFEFRFDLSAEVPPAAEMREGEHYREIGLGLPQQQESVAYLPGGGFVYTTEAGSPGGVPLVGMACLEP